VITKAQYGWSPARLVIYLMGKGKREEHRNPHVVASWDGLDSRWQPEQIGPTEFDLRLGPMIDALHAPAIAAGLPLRHDAATQRGRTKNGYVWHCSVRNRAEDPDLSDQQWAAIAREVLHGTGIATHRDHGGPRWFAVRHADDHIHIAVVLVRQDTSRRFWPEFDRWRLRAVAANLERRYGLELTAPADQTAAPGQRRGELEKASRSGALPARIELARAVRDAAARTFTPEAFVEELRRMGYLAELRYLPSGDPIGYKIARTADVNADGQPVYYGGSKLAPDLSLPRLLKRWASASTPVPNTSASARERQSLLDEARRSAEQARSCVRGARAGQHVEDPDGIAHATADMFTALRNLAGEGQPGGPATAAAQRYDRACRAPHDPVPQLGELAAELRGLAWQLMALRGLRGGEQPAAVLLAVALAALALEIAALQRTRGRVHQARAAREAAWLARRWRPRRPTTAGGLAAGMPLQRGSSGQLPTPQKARTS